MCRFATLALVIALVANTAIAADDLHPIAADMKKKLKDPAKPFTVFVTVKVKAGKEAAFEAAFLGCAKDTLKEKGVLRYEINRDADHPEVFVLYEKWKNLDGLNDHLNLPHTVKLLK